VSSKARQEQEVELKRFESEQLVEAREALGLTSEAVAQSLNLPAKHIWAIETGEVERLPSLVFARGYIRAYAKLVELDADELIDQFDQVYDPGSGNRKKKLKTVNCVEEQVKLGDPMVRWSGWLFLVVVLGATGWWWQTQYQGGSISVSPSSDQPVVVDTVDGNTLTLPALSDSDEDIAEEAGDAAPQAADETEPEPQYLNAEQINNLQQQLDQNQSDGSLPAETEATTDSAEVAPVSESDDQAANTAEVEEIEPQQIAVNTNDAATAAEVATAAEGKLEILFRDECWVTVKDADGKTIFNNLRRNGQELSISGKAPLNVLVGRVSAVSSFRYDGKTIDLESVSNKDVARLTLPNS